KKREVAVINDETGDVKTYVIPYTSTIVVREGQEIEAGDSLTSGSINPHDLLRIKGLRAVQDYILKEVQKVYRLQGVDINDKHIEIIVHQMLKKIKIDDPGDSQFLPGAMIDVLDFEDINDALEAEEKKPAKGTKIVLGITKASLATNSFLSAASFQETTKVLTDAAIKGKIDPLIGLKENVLIGKLIPAGTGMKRYRHVKLDSDERIEQQREEALKAEILEDIEPLDIPDEAFAELENETFDLDLESLADDFDDEFEDDFTEEADEAEELESDALDKEDAVDEEPQDETEE
ncbi:MAG: DNA-directed RNA polymerase subunit beta', partial [Lachnospiraceae bacterium]|nr:DNA-directed RNA polymerase subunit beta' [Lachnospiraceae bacterium]